MRRREFLLSTALVAAAPALGCRKAPTRSEVLSALVLDVVVPRTQKLAAESRVLHDLLQTLVRSPSTAALTAARTRWKAALLSWKRAYSFRNGPIVETNAMLNAMFWPARPTAIEAVVLAPGRASQDRIDELGADVRGLFALEYLLFGTDTSQLRFDDRLLGSEGEPRRLLALSFAADVAAHASRAAGTLGDGKTFASKFSARGQEALGRVVNQLVETVEGVLERVTRIQGLYASRMLKPQAVEGYASGTSRDIAMALLDGARSLYQGGPSGGLHALVAAVAPAIAERGPGSFEAAIKAVQELEVPLEMAAGKRTSELQAAAALIKSLELALKVEVASALGITLTVIAGDGD